LEKLSGIRRSYSHIRIVIEEIDARCPSTAIPVERLTSDSSSHCGRKSRAGDIISGSVHGSIDVEFVASDISGADSHIRSVVINYSRRKSVGSRPAGKVVGGSGSESRGSGSGDGESIVSRSGESEVVGAKVDSFSVGSGESKRVVESESFRVESESSGSGSDGNAVVGSGGDIASS